MKMSVTLTTPINSICFLCELDRLVLATQGETQGVTLKIKKDASVIFENTYYPDSTGRIVVYDLDKVLEPCLDLGSLASNVFCFYANDVSIVTTDDTLNPRCVVLPSTAAVGEAAIDFVPDFFLTAAMWERDTAVGRFETLTPFTTSSTAVSVVASYHDGSALKTRTFALAAVDGCSQIDVSPSKFVDSAKGDLIGYEVVCGGRKARYRVLKSMPKANPAVIFRNSFGAWETFHFTGTKSQEPSYTRSTAIIDGDFRTYDIEETMQWKVRTGSLRHGMVAVANDLARSKDVYLLAKDGTPGDRIEITDCDMKSDNADTIPDLEITYRLARRSARIDVVRPPKIFDYTFDETYE